MNWHHYSAQHIVYCVCDAVMRKKSGGQSSLLKVMAVKTVCMYGICVSVVYSCVIR